MLIVSGRGDRRRHCRWSHLLNNVARTLKPGWARGTRGSRGSIDETAFAVAGGGAWYNSRCLFFGRTLQRFRGAVSLQMES